MTKEELKNISQNQSQKFKKAYKSYIGGVGLKDFDKLVRFEVPEVYDFYAKRIKKKERRKNSIREFFYFLKDLFKEFLFQLTPLRRILYTIAIFFFVWAIFLNDWNYALFSFFLINLLLAFELADKLTAKSELDVARNIQLSLMPEEAPLNNMFDISCYSETAKEVGGDYFDFICGENGDLKILIGDISGKGMGAALHMVQVQSVLYQIGAAENSPKNILSELNKNLRRLLKRGTFFTAGMIQLNGSRTLNYCRAGHLPLIHFKKNKNEIELYTPKGTGIGMVDSPAFDIFLEEQKIEFEPGDIFLLITDGITEARNNHNNEYEMQRLKKLLMLYKDNSAGELKDVIVKNVKQFIGASPVHDDFTFVVMKALG